MTKPYLSFLPLLFLPLLSHAETKLNKDWNNLFSEHKASGVFILCKNQTSECETSDLSRAQTAYIPASTFKIANTLIALETGVISDPSKTFKWDGITRSISSWNQDFTLRGAFQNSVVPIYQKMASEVGEKRMQQLLKKLHYGNENSEGGIERFWLDGKLRISAQQQVSFLEKLNRGQLNASKLNQLLVTDIMVSEATTDYVIRSKTGYSLGAPGYGDTSKPGIAWWVGWVERGIDTYYFACNVDVPDSTMLGLRKTIPLQAMKSSGALP